MPVRVSPILVLVGCYALTVQSSSDMMDVEIVSLLSLDSAVGPSLLWTGAPMYLAKSIVNDMFSGINMSVEEAQKTRTLTCGQASDDSATYVAETYYKHIEGKKRCFAILGSGCNDPIGISRLVREWDVLYLVTSFPPPELPNPALFPNTLLMGPSQDTLAAATAGIMVYYKWFHITVLVDTATFTSFYAAQTQALKMRFARNPAFDVDVIYLNASDGRAVREALLVGARRSRVFFLMTAIGVILKNLRIASDLGMGNGEYVFVNILAQAMKPYGSPTMFDNPDATMWNVTRSMQYISLAQPSRGSPELIEKIEKLAMKKYNSTYPAESPAARNFVVHGTMDSVEVFGAAVAEMRELNPSGKCSASELKPRITGRTFSLSRGEAYISHDGTKNYDVSLETFNTATGRMESLLLYNATSNTVDTVGNFSPDWAGGSVPLDIPLCGFAGNIGPCLPHPPSYLSIELAIPVVTVAAIAVALLFWKWQQAVARASVMGKFWLIDKKELSPFSQMTADLGGGPGNWKGTPVWQTFVERPEKFDLSRASRCLLFAQHANVVKNYGICICPGYLMIVSEFCTKGSLVDLFKLSTVELDFKLAFLVDLIQGLMFLHSAIGPHGHLCLSYCLVDSHFTLKISNYGLCELRSYLGARPTASEKSVYWTNPEILSPTGKKSIPGDVFSLGLIMATLFSDYPVTSKTLNGFLVHEALPRVEMLVRDCVAENPQNRPAVRVVWKRVTEAFPNKRLKNVSVAQKIIDRFALYTTALEAAIGVRTTELLSERAKCDALLRELLPPFVVNELRNHQAVQADMFESVTIYFSELEGFLNWAAVVEPSVVLQTLSVINNLFDHRLAEYVVQKVESVRDCYMVVGGIPERAGAAHSVEVCRMALGLQQYFAKIGSSVDFKLRCGIHTGPCATGVIGSKIPRYCLFGDTVNIASRIQTTGSGGRVHLSQQTASLVEKRPLFLVIERGLIELKGKGMMQTYWLEEPPATETKPAIETNGQ